jgi:hypothetical protein
MTASVSAGAARSKEEIVDYLSWAAICPNCKHQGLGVIDIDSSAIAEAQCALCDTRVTVTFTAGPGWGNEPTDLRMATGDAPSTLLPESFFRRDLQQLARRLDDPEFQRPASLCSSAGAGLKALIELGKLRRAAGATLDAANMALLARFREVYVANGGELTPEVEAALRP